jgi:nucleoside-diphosphate kinase
VRKEITLIEKTLVVIKPDAVLQDWTQMIIDCYKRAGLTVLTSSDIKIDIHQARLFYAEHLDKPFFAGLILAMSSGPAAVLVLEGDDAINRVRNLNGATDPRRAEPGTIRHDFMSAGGPFNTVHASDSPEAAQREIALFESWFA